MQCQDSPPLWLVQAWIDPTMIEVGARLSGGHKSEMAQLVVVGWAPFSALIDAHRWRV
jgi:hypothetical protein